MEKTCPWGMSTIASLPAMFNTQKVSHPHVSTKSWRFKFFQSLQKQYLLCTARRLFLIFNNVAGWSNGVMHDLHFLCRNILEWNMDKIGINLRHKCNCQFAFRSNFNFCPVSYCTVKLDQRKKTICFSWPIAVQETFKSNKIEHP